MSALALLRRVAGRPAGEPGATDPQTDQHPDGGAVPAPEPAPEPARSATACLRSREEGSFPPRLPRLPRHAAYQPAGTAVAALYRVPDPADRPAWVQDLGPAWLHPRGGDSVFFCGQRVADPDGSRWVELPRLLGAALFGPPARDLRTAGAEIPPDRRAFRGRLTEVQRAASRAALAALASDATLNGTNLQLPCGFGKTVLAIHTVLRLGRRTVILVHTKQLKEQWEDRIRDFAPGLLVGEDVQVLLVQASMDRTEKEPGRKPRGPARKPSGPPPREPVPERPFVVPADDVGLLVVDEAHHIAARSFATALRRFRPRYTMTLTATPKRGDGLERLIYWLAGFPSFVTSARSGLRTEHGQVLVDLGPPRGWPASALADPRSVSDVLRVVLLSRLAQDDRLNQLIAYDIVDRWVADRRRHPLVLSARRDQLWAIGRHMRSRVAQLGLFAHLGRGLLQDRRAVTRRGLTAVVGEYTSQYAPHRLPLDAQMQANGVRVASQDVALPRGDLVVHLLRLDHGIAGDQAHGWIQLGPDRYLVRVRDWDGLALLQDLGPGKRPADDLLRDLEADPGETGEQHHQRRMHEQPRALTPDGDDGALDEPELATRVRLVHKASLRYPPDLRLDARSALTSRELLHGPAGVHRACEGQLAVRTQLACVVRRALPGRPASDAALVAGLVADMLNPSCRIGFCVGGMAKARWQPLLASNILLATIKQCEEGFDHPICDHKVDVTPPTGNLVQALGRVQRTHPLKVAPVLCTSYLPAYARALFQDNADRWDRALASAGSQRLADRELGATPGQT